MDVIMTQHMSSVIAKTALNRENEYSIITEVKFLRILCWSSEVIHSFQLGKKIIEKLGPGLLNA